MRKLKVSYAMTVREMKKWFYLGNGWLKPSAFTNAFQHLKIGLSVLKGSKDSAKLNSAR